MLGTVLSIQLSGCNGDIFVDSEVLPEISKITIEGDGGEWSTPISRKGLVRMYIKVDYDEEKYVNYFDVNNKITDETCPASDLENIIYENPIRYYSISFYGDMLYISSWYNAAEEKHFGVYLEYDYGVKQIDVTVSKGTPLQFLYQIPTSQEIEVEEDIETISHSISFSNGSSITQFFNVYPYAETSATCMIKTDAEWANGLMSEQLVPIYHFEWMWTNMTDCVIGKSFSFLPEQLLDFYFIISVQPGQKATVNYDMHYSKATDASTLVYYNTVSDVQYEVPVETTCVCPSVYDHKVIFEDL